jgi:hypothetical protein
MKSRRLQLLLPGLLPLLVLASETRAFLPFIDDDYSRALAEARARHVPIFLEAWAPW